MDVVLDDVEQSLELADELASSEKYTYGRGLEVPDSRYLPAAIKSSFARQEWPTCKYRCIVGEMPVDIVVSMCTNRVLAHTDVHEIVTMTLAAVYFCYAHTACVPPKELSLTLALSRFKKVMHSARAQLGPSEVNTGFTIRRGGEAAIVVYRREEWFKVLLHECLHAFQVEPRTGMLDRALGDKLKVTAFDFGEAYVEFWARILNCAFASVLGNHHDAQARRTIAKEQKHALALVPAVLHTYDRTVSSLFTSRHAHLTEKSNVIAYYVVATILLMNYETVMSACDVRYRSNYLSFPGAKAQFFKQLVLSYRLRIPETEKKPRRGLSLAMTTIRAV